MGNAKTKKIVFRAESNLYNFLRDFAALNDMTVSELLRNVVVYFHMGYLMGEFTKTLPQLKIDFKSAKKNKFKDMDVKPLREKLQFNRK
jgi:hypothetical protein